jgi:hypothetical protein
VRPLLTTASTAAISDALCFAPHYRTADSSATFLQINPAASSILLLPMGFVFLGHRARLLAGALTFGLFYLPIAVALLWPAKRESAERKTPSPCRPGVFTKAID